MKDYNPKDSIKRINAMLFEEDIFKKIKQPDSEVSKMWDERFRELNKSLSNPEYIEKCLEEERKRNTETARRANNYWLV